ncbi:toll/interleukin-1 receptor domain-containing protein [Photobacterium chitinilyticum]|uniref:Toll/interleukin-1 receptor domain-containing protein n=2 Tax=Photobacterium chitinilyticum TaxID=2485123 RepID=A0A3S3RXQ8_9GAMM|nr:toll/interleukin-1 receptor domain-containing protein [Photobacterium chitinilyticum]
MNKSKRKYKYDFFISHATEDKDIFVRELASELINLGSTVWYDELSLSIGDSLRRKIDLGLSKSRFGVVVLSPDFLKKEWTQYELDALVNKSMSEGKVILPIWHNVSWVEVSNYSHSLADKVAIKTEHEDINNIARRLFSLVEDVDNQLVVD